MTNNYIGDNHIGHNYIGHNYVGQPDEMDHRPRLQVRPIGVQHVRRRGEPVAPFLKKIRARRRQNVASQTKKRMLFVQSSFSTRRTLRGGGMLRRAGAALSVARRVRSISRDHAPCLHAGLIACPHTCVYASLHPRLYAFLCEFMHTCLCMHACNICLHTCPYTYVRTQGLIPNRYYQNLGYDGPSVAALFTPHG